MSGDVICVVFIEVDDEGITGGVCLVGVFKRREACRGGGASGGADLRGGRGGVLLSTFIFDNRGPLSYIRNGLWLIL